MSENISPHFRATAEVNAIVAAAGATADWLFHNKRETCAVVLIRHGKRSAMVYIPANPDARPAAYLEALADLRTAIEELEDTHG
ncbi:hypothetical protein ACIBEJ_09185 [Nonomuraea sp. NPDC050790]|uniref:hypothetical protein n=1 Tax=Nonomuraea sp. NPDC050790 TaxID=3364371 RepID=UPI00378B6405